MARILIVEARFYAHLNDLLLEGAEAALAGHEIEVVTVPGALEVPGAIALARTPAGPHSTARLRASCATAALVMP